MTDISAITNKLADASVGPKGVVSFSGKGLKLDNHEDAESVVSAINSCTDMKVLRLDGNTVGVEAAKAIADALKSHSEFEEALWSDMFTGRLRSEIPPALFALGAAIITSGAHLTELDLSDNAFGADGVKGIVDVLKSPCGYTLKVLKFNNNGLGIAGGKVLAEALIVCHKLSSAAGKPLALKTFIAGRNRLENPGAIALAGAFKIIGTLEEVQMPQNGIYHEGISALADAFAHNKNLRVLSLSDNTFTEKGAIAMANALPSMTNLEIINFGDCLLKTGGAKAIGNALQSGHIKLQELTLAFDEITKQGALAVIDSLRKKPQLKKIDLNGNMFGQEFIEVLREKLEEIGVASALQSLSDDEGSDEEDGDDDDDDDDDDEEDHSPRHSLPHVVPPNSAITLTAGSEVVTIERFLEEPTVQNLKAMGPERKKMFEAYLSEGLDADQVIEIFMKLSAVLSAALPTDDEVRDACCDCAGTLFEKACSSDSVSLAILCNRILEQLGLIKSEVKFKLASDMSGPLIILENLAKKPFFPKTIKDVLQLFLSRPCKHLEPYSKHRHKLLQTLYSV